MVTLLTQWDRARASGKRNGRKSETLGAVTPMTASGVPVSCSFSL